MPYPYTPPLPRRAQAVRSSRRGAARRFRWWFPLLGLVPVVVVAAAALATAGRRATSPGPLAVATEVVTPTSLPTSVAPTPTRPAPTPTSRASDAATLAPTTAPAGVAAAPTTAVGPTQGTPSTSATSAAAARDATPSASTTAVTGPFREYRVQPGDTIRSIAQRYGVSLATIARASGLTNPDQLSVGQVLTIPDQNGYLYRVQPGETLDQIAARSGVSTAAVMSASHLTTSSVSPGDVVLIPDQGTPASK